MKKAPHGEARKRWEEGSELSRDTSDDENRDLYFLPDSFWHLYGDTS